MGYHKREIPRGKFGDFSKIEEEFWEAKDANERGIIVMELTELSDMYGAMQAYLEKHHRMSMEDLAKMSKVTSEAFGDGTRVAREVSDD